MKLEWSDRTRAATIFMIKSGLAFAVVMGLPLTEIQTTMALVFAEAVVTWTALIVKTGQGE